MMYWTFPGVSATDRLDHSPKLDPAKIVLSPIEAAEKVGAQANPTQIRLNSFDGRPVYRIGGGGRGGGGARIIYADTGEEQTEVSTEMLDRIASLWAGQPLDTAKKESVEEPDQWTVAGQLRNLRPMYKYSWPDGQQVYLNGMTGEVVQYTTFGSRVAAHVSAIPHWFYYTPLRKHQPWWINFMIWSCIIGTGGAILGMVVAVWMYSPKLRYRLDGQPTGIPYRGQKRWHWIFGMVFGVATVTWTFSGLLSLGPFPLVQRLTGTGPRTPQQQAAANSEQAENTATNPQRGEIPSANRPSGDSGLPRQRGEGQVQGQGRGSGRGGRGGTGTGERRSNQNATNSSREEPTPTGSAPANAENPVAATTANAGRGGQPPRNQTRPAGGGRGGGQQSIAGALRGRVRMADFAEVHPRDLLAKVPNLDVRELEWTSFAGAPLFSANLPGG